MDKLAAKRLSFPKKREDVERVVEEVESSLEHEDRHHHHHNVDDIIVTLQMLAESLNARVSSLESKMSDQGLEIARLYKVLSYIVEALMAEGDSDRRGALIKALKTLEK